MRSLKNAEILLAGLALLAGCPHKDDNLSQLLHLEERVFTRVGTDARPELEMGLDMVEADIPAAMMCKVYTNNEKINVNFDGPEKECKTTLAQSRQDVTCTITKAGKYRLNVKMAAEGESAKIDFACFKLPTLQISPKCPNSEACPKPDLAACEKLINKKTPIVIKPTTRVVKSLATVANPPPDVKLRPPQTEPDEAKPPPPGPEPPPLPPGTPDQRQITAVRGMPTSELTLACSRPLREGTSGKIGVLTDQENRKQWVFGEFSVQDGANCDIFVRGFKAPGRLLRLKHSVSLWY